MNVTEIDNVFHCDCGFSWQRGKSGAHDCTVGLRAQRDQLAAEASYLRGEIKQHSQSTHFCEVCGKDDPCINDDVCMALDKTPATDAWQREQWARGVDAFAERKHRELFSLHPDTHGIGALAATMSAQVSELKGFAEKLRNGEAV